MYEETDATKLCLGLLLVEERQMTIFERAALTREGTSWGRKTWWAWGIYGTSIALFLLFAVNSNPNSVLAKEVLFVTCVLLMLIGFPLCILLSRDWVRRSRGFRLSASHGNISLYEGEVPEEAFADPAYPQLDRLDGLFSQVHCTLGVLTGSRAVWKMNEKRVSAWITVPEIEVAEVPSSLTTSGCRGLSSREKEALRGHAHRAWLQIFPLALGLSAWVGIHISGVTLTELRGNLLHWLPLLALVASATSADFALVRGILHSRGLSVDRREGVVSIMRAGGDADEINTEPEAWMEVLPHSKLLWTEKGIPAVWRKVQLPSNLALLLSARVGYYSGIS